MEYREVRISEIKESKYNPSIRTDRTKKGYKELRNSIEKYGLITPITLGVGKKELLLVAGHRRLNCYKDLGKLTIEANINPKIDDSNYDRMFVAENKYSLPLSAAQETGRYLDGAPDISSDVLKVIKEFEAIGGRNAVKRVVSEGKSTNTYMIGIKKYTSYIKSKTKRSQKQCLYWMFNIGTAYQLKNAMGAFVDANIIKDCVENRKKLEISWLPSQNNK